MVRATLRGHYREDGRYPAAMVNITNRCNLSCQHCFVFRDGNPNEEPPSAREDMPDEAILETLAELRDRHGYGNDVDCARCGAWVVFSLAAKFGVGDGSVAPQERARRLLP